MKFYKLILVFICASLAACSSNLPTRQSSSQALSEADQPAIVHDPMHPTLNGLRVLSIYYDEVEEDTGCPHCKYHVYLFFLEGNKFIVWRNHDPAEYIVNNFMTLETQYPSVKHPSEYKIDGNKITAIRKIDSRDKQGKLSYTHIENSEGEFRDGVLYMVTKSSTIYPDGRSGQTFVSTRDFRKIKEY